MTIRNAVKLLLGLALGLPLLQAILWWVSGLLTAMGDQRASGVLQNIITACSVLWLVGLVGLIVALAVNSLSEPPPDE